MEVKMLNCCRIERPSNKNTDSSREMQNCAPATIVIASLITSGSMLLADAVARSIVEVSSTPKAVDESGGGSAVRCNQ